MNPMDQTTGYKAQLVDSLYQNPATRGRLLEVIKDAYPTIRIPEIEARAEVAAAVAPMAQTIQQLQTELSTRDMREAHNQVRRRHDFSESEWQEVQDLAVKRQIGDMGAAAELYLAQQQTASPRFAPTPIRQPDQKQLWQNPARWAREEAYNVLNEFAAANARRR